MSLCAFRTSRARVGKDIHEWMDSEQSTVVRCYIHNSDGTAIRRIYVLSQQIDLTWTLVVTCHLAGVEA